ncbi:MAG: hypothetical protein AB7F09_15795 [Parvibaculaceae bacterium]
MADFPHSTPAPEILRPVIESEIERLIAILDVLDGDPDLEDDETEADNADDEPSLGFSEWGSIWSRPGEYSSPEADLELDDYDNEPSLGSPNVSLPAPLYGFFCGVSYAMFPVHRCEPAQLTYGNCQGFSQTTWAEGFGDDREEQCEDEGAPDSDLEPELGWTEMEARFKGYVDFGEPSLGSLGCINQELWAHGGTGDHEEQCEDEGFDSDTERVEYL